MSSPVVGFGLDFQYASRYPSGIAGMCDAFRDRLSHVSIVGVNTAEEAAWFREHVAKRLLTVHHLSNVAPADPQGPNVARYAFLDTISRQLGAEWTCEDVGIWSIGPYGIPYFAPPIFERAVAREISARMKRLLDRSSLPFLLEVPSCSFVTGTQDLGSFFHDLVEGTSCPMLLDIGHVFSYAIVTGANPLAVLHSLPLDSVWEMHVAGGRTNERHPHRYIDTHADPVMPQVLELMLEAIPACPNLRTITLELAQDVSHAYVEDQLARVEAVARRASFAPFAAMGA